MSDHRSKDAYYHVVRAFQDRHAQQRGQATWTCTCPDHQTRNVICKHIHAVQLVEDSRWCSGTQRARRNWRGRTKDYLPCLQEREDYKMGQTERPTSERFRDMHCNDCGHKFVVDKGFCRMKSQPEDQSPWHLTFTSKAFHWGRSPTT